MLGVHAVTLEVTVCNAAKKCHEERSTLHLTMLTETIKILSLKGSYGRNLLICVISFYHSLIVHVRLIGLISESLALITKIHTQTH